MPNPTGRHRPKRRHPNEGTVILRKDRWRARPWAAVIPYLDAAGFRRETWLSASSRQEAEALRKAEVARRDKGFVRTDLTVGEYVSTWLDTLEVGPGTLPRYRAHLTERLDPTCGMVALDKLTPPMVRAAVGRWGGAPATRAGALRLLRAAMKQAVLDRAIEHDPTAGIPYPRIAHKPPRTLTGEQARHLIAVVKEAANGEAGMGHDDADEHVAATGVQQRDLHPVDAGAPSEDADHRRGVRTPLRTHRLYGQILIVSLGLGLRRGEAIGLRTQDVDLRAGTVTIAKSLRYIAPELRAPDEGPYRLKATKTGDERVLPLPGFVATALRERIEQRDQEQRAAKVWAPNDFVFCSEVGNSVPINSLYGWFKRMLERAGLPDMRWHALRASTATLLIEMGVDLVTVQRILGHRDPATTLLYIGATPKALQGAADKLGEAMG